VSKKYIFCNNISGDGILSDRAGQKEAPQLFIFVFQTRS